jgi:hypothetical protein
MKANEAPEKIYVQLPSRNWIGRLWNETPIKEGDNPNWKNATNIEYTHTDAFIEKACSILKDISCPFEIIEQFKNRIR